MELKDRTIDDCKQCIWKHVDGYCTSWDCDFVSRQEAREAIEYVRGERDGQILDRIEKAKKQALERLDYYLEVDDAPDFVQITGSVGGDIVTYRFWDAGYVTEL